MIDKEKNTEELFLLLRKKQNISGQNKQIKILKNEKEY